MDICSHKSAQKKIRNIDIIDIGSAVRQKQQRPVPVFTDTEPAHPKYVPGPHIRQQLTASIANTGPRGVRRSLSLIDSAPNVCRIKLSAHVMRIVREDRNTVI